MADIDFRDFGVNLIGAARTRFGDFLSENKDVDDIIVKTGTLYASYSADYHLAATDEERQAAADALRQLRNTADLMFDGLAHLAKSEILAQLKAALGMVLEFAIQNLPTIISLIKR